MKNAGIICMLLFMLGCAHKTYRTEEVANPEFTKNTVFVSSENISLPKFDSLKMKYQLDTIFNGEEDEFKRILLLRNWIRKTISINDFSPAYPGEGNPEGILDAAIKGHGFHCGHYMVVQNAVLNAYGYVTRCLGSGPGVKGGPDGHHGINEVWLNKYQKWFLSDAKYNHHFEKNGVPLSALEIRDEYLKNKAADIILVKGPDRTPIEAHEVANNKGVYIRKSKEQSAQWYTWLEWDIKNDRYSTGPTFGSDINMYRDAYFKTHTWIWDGKPHWSYNTEHVKYIDSREAIEWTPNTIQSAVLIKDDSAKITLSSVTPNFREYQMKESSEESWVKCDSLITLPLNKDRIELSFRTVNIANIAGPINKVVLASN